MRKTFDDSTKTRRAWIVMIVFVGLCIALSAFSNPIQPARADLGIAVGSHLDDDGGQSVKLFGDINVMNQSLGWYVVRTYEGNDPENIIVGVDYGVKPFGGPVKLSIGPAYAQDPLRGGGQNANFHLAAGFDIGKHLTVSLDHWSNCRRVCNHNMDTSKNPPRNMLMMGVKF